MNPEPVIKNQKGQSAVEFAFVLPLLIAIMLALGSLSTIVYNWVVLQYAASEASRFGSLGQIDPGFETREASIENRVVQIAESLGIGGVAVAFSDEDGNPTAGSSSEFFKITLTRSLEMQPVLGLFFALTGGGGTASAYQVRVGTVIRNEPF